MTDVRDQYESSYSSFRGLPGYEREAQYVDTLADLLAARGLVPARRDATLADLGSGAGFKTHALAQRFGRVVGFDFSESAVELASRLNDHPDLAFRRLDVLNDDPGERFDVATAFGLSVLNERSVDELARRVRALADNFVSPGGVLAVVGQTDLSGQERDGWFNHTRGQLAAARKRLAGDGGEVRLYWPHRDPRSYVSFGAEHALRQLALPLLRRRRDYCLVVRVPAAR